MIDNIDYSNISYNGFKYDVNDLNKNLIIEKRDKAIIEKFQIDFLLLDLPKVKAK